jgi:hypothetical protein
MSVFSGGGGRKGWDFSSYEDCVGHYANRSFPGEIELWNLLHIIVKNLMALVFGGFMCKKTFSAFTKVCKTIAFYLIRLKANTFICGFVGNFSARNDSYSVRIIVI